MRLIGPKSVASTLHLLVKIVFILVVASAVTMAIAPILPPFSRNAAYAAFVVRSGPLSVSFGVLRGIEARWWIWAMEVVSRTCHAVILYLLMRMLAPTKAGEPFDPRMPIYLRMMGGVVILGSILRTVFCAELMNRGMGWRPESGVWVSWAIDFDAIILGIVLVVLAEVFRRGYALKTENELTV